MTASGIAGNLEVTSVFECGVEQDGNQALLNSVWRYLKKVLLSAHPAVSHQLAWMESRTNWISAEESGQTLVGLSDDSEGTVYPRGFRAIYFAAIHRTSRARRY